METSREFPKLIDLNSKVEIAINSDEFLIGRGMRNSFIIEDLQVSRTHCIIDKSGNNWRIIDKSVNGTRVNDKPLPKNCPVVLTHGDVVGVSESSKFLFSNKPPDKAGGITETDIVDLTDALIAEIDVAEGVSECKDAVLPPPPAVVDLIETNKCEVVGVTVERESDSRKEAAQLEKNMENAENEFQCSICTELFIRAVTLNCSHTFCNYCISEWRKKQSVCPICRAKITTAFPTLVVDNFIEKMLEGASEDVKSKRKEVVLSREQLDPKPLANNNKKASPGPGPGPGTIEVSSDDESYDSTDSEDSDWEYEYDNDVFDVYDGYNGIPGAYYGGYGHCFNCGDRGHWANGCPNR